MNREIIDWNNCHTSEQLKSISTTKNKLEKDFDELDCISKKAVQTRLKEIINEMETIFADIREREVNDSVCGLCEYDCSHGLDGFANECPGFEKDDCFKLNEKYKAEWLDISNLPSLTPQKPKIGHCKDCKYFEYDSMANVDGVPLIVAHEICSKWGDGCKTRENGYCFLFEPKADLREVKE